MAGPYAGLELLATAVVALDEGFEVRYANPAAENLLGIGAKSLQGQRFAALFEKSPDLEKALAEALTTHWDYAAQNVSYLRAGREPLPLSCVLTRFESAHARLLVELRPIEKKSLKVGFIPITCGTNGTTSPSPV